MPRLRLPDRVALITGGGSGIGAAAAILFAEEGAKIVVSGRREGPLKETVKTINDAGGEAAFITGDVTQLDDVERMVQFTVDTFGRVDILINSAGVIKRTEVIEDATPEDWAWQMDTNARSVFYTCKFALPQMMKQGYGAIVNIGSVSSLLASNGYATYCASKGAVRSYTRVVALQYAEHGIRANVVEPAGIQTPMAYMDRPNYETGLDSAIKRNYPIARPGQAQDVAYAALFLASNESSWITGQSIIVDGGMSLK